MPAPKMRPRSRVLLVGTLLAGLIGLGVLTYLFVLAVRELAWLPALVFAALSILILTLAIVAVALLVQRWAGARHELEQRVAELSPMAFQEAQLHAEDHKRVRQLETIGQVSRQVSATLDLGDLFKRIVRLVRDNFGYYHVAIYSADPQRRTVTFQASASAGEEDVAFDVAWGEGLIGWVAANGQAVTVNDVEQDPRYHSIEALDETRSELAVPLVLDGEQVGVLDVQSDQAAAFGADDLFILETLGAQIAVAIHGARLYEAERQQAWLSTALLQVADAMGRVSDMDAVLTSVVRLTPILAGVDRCAILLWDADSETFVPAQTHGLTPELRDTFGHMVFSEGDLPALDLVREDKSPLLVETAADLAPSGQGLIPPALAETFDIQEMVLLPLLAQGELLGVMMVDYAGRAPHFSERVIGMLAGIANQAAMVIQSARLVQAQREEAYVSMALLQVAEAVSRSTELEETLASIVRITPMLVGVETCALFLWNPSTSSFIPAQQYGLKGEARSAFRHLHLEDHEPLVQALGQGQSFVDLDDLDGSSSIVSLFGPHPLLALPITSKGERLGLMTVGYAGSAHRSAQRWTNILGGIAGQAAVAIENDRLLRQEAEQERTKQELEVARRIQVSILPECCPNLPGWEFAAIWQSARQVSGDFYDFIPLPPHATDQGLETPRMALVVADVADKGVPAALFMVLSRTLVRTMASDGRPPAVTIARANELILADTSSGLFVTLFYTLLQSGAGDITYVNAGHMPPLLVRAGGGAIEQLRVPGVALGILPDAHYDEHTAYLEVGDLLVLYTDGVTDAANADRQTFGLERLQQVAAAHSGRSAHELAGAVHEAVTAFAGDVAQFDDFTLVVARRLA